MPEIALRAVFAAEPLPGWIGCLELLHPYQDREHERVRLMPQWVLPVESANTVDLMTEHISIDPEPAATEHKRGWPSKEGGERDMELDEWLAHVDGKLADLHVVPPPAVAKKRRRPGGPRSRGRRAKRGRG